MSPISPLAVYNPPSFTVPETGEAQFMNKEMIPRAITSDRLQTIHHLLESEARSQRVMRQQQQWGDRGAVCLGFGLKVANLLAEVKGVLETHSVCVLQGSPAGSDGVERKELGAGAVICHQRSSASRLSAIRSLLVSAITPPASSDPSFCLHCFPPSNLPCELAAPRPKLQTMTTS